MGIHVTISAVNNVNMRSRTVGNKCPTYAVVDRKNECAPNGKGQEETSWVINGS